MDTVRFKVSGLLAILMLTLSACSTPEPGVTNELGTIQGKLNASPPEVIEAARATLEDLDLTVADAESDELGGRLEAESALGDKVSIWVRRQGEGVSTVNVRVGTFGNQDQSLAILNRIQDRLE